MALKKLFEPVKIGKMTLRNRIVMPAMGTNYGTDDGYVTERVKSYYEARAKGGTGLITTEIIGVDFPVGKALAYQLAVDNDKYIPGLHSLAECIQKHGAKACLQLHHAGRETSNTTAHLTVGASPVEGVRHRIPRELTIPEIKQIVSRFGEGARRAREAGFDCVEVHGAHYYLFNQFLSPWSNKRQDAYGGSLVNRVRLYLEVIDAIKEKAGADFPLICRINGAEYGMKGLTFEDFLAAAKLVEEHGADALHVSAFGIGEDALRGLTVYEPGCLVGLAAAAKKIVKIPVITVGRLDNPELAERILGEGKADLVAIGRGVIADPELPNKAAVGRLEDIVPCIACFECAERVTFREAPIECSVNPAAGKERERVIKPAPKRKKVLVVGGGPAGLEAAIVASLRGHQVVLYEKSPELGGRLIPAARPPEKKDFYNYIDYLRRQVKKLKVEVHTGEAVSPAIVDKVKPDVVIVASGSELTIPGIPGLEKAMFATADDLLVGKAQAAEKVVVIGGGMIGCETAEYLANQGKKVTIVEIADELAMDRSLLIRTPLLYRLKRKGVSLRSGVKPEKITGQGLLIKDKEGKAQTIEAGSYVIAAGSRPNSDHFQWLRDKASEVYFVGDCVEVKGILEATGQAFDVASKI